MLSESQERMLMCVKRGREEEALRIFRKWDLDAEVIGEVTGDGFARIAESGRIVASVPAAPLSDRSPIYERPVGDPIPPARDRFDPGRVAVPTDLGAVLLRLLGSPNLCSKEWVYRQYDHTVGASTVVVPGSDAAVVRVKGTGLALALSSDCNSRYVHLDPAAGGALAVAESARNVACAGAMPLALTDCLNFGSPESPAIMGQFARAVDGISRACRALDVPVISGNVSFYNETDGRAIFPTPTVAVVGLLEEAHRATTQWFKREGDRVVLLGITRDEIGASEYLSLVHGLEEGPPPALDLAAEAGLQRFLVEAASLGLLSSAHDASDGGLAVALAECCFSGPGLFGADLSLPAPGKAIRPDALLFGESASRAVLSAPASSLRSLEYMALAHKVPLAVIGEVRRNGADARLKIRSGEGTLIDARVADLKSVWENAFPRLMGGS
jgi:phosphoribosylformylglycinamidine synthase